MDLRHLFELMQNGADVDALTTAYAAVKNDAEAARRTALRAFVGECRFPASRLFHENSKITHGWWPPISAEEAAERTLDLGYLRHRDRPQLRLPAARRPITKPVAELLAMRRGRHVFGGPLPLEDLATLLELGAGVTERGRIPRRAAPSGGALYPVELYVVALDVVGLDPGIYHYAPTDGVLEALRPIDGADALVGVFPRDLARAAPPVAIVMTAVLERTQQKYGERGYRFALLEAGHIAQNLLLLATGLELSSLPVGGFFDDALDALLGIDGERQVAIYSVLIGRNGSEERRNQHVPEVDASDGRDPRTRNPGSGVSGEAARIAGACTGRQ